MNTIKKILEPRFGKFMIVGALALTFYLSTTTIYTTYRPELYTIKEIFSWILLIAHFPNALLFGITKSLYGDNLLPKYYSYAYPGIQYLSLITYWYLLASMLYFIFRKGKQLFQKT